MANEMNGKKPDEKEDKAQKGFPPQADKDKDDKEKKDKDKEMDKALITEADLLKSCDKLEGIAKSGPAGRKQELLKKALEGKATDEEQAELAKSLTGAGAGALSEEIKKSLSPEGNEEFAKAFEASKFLAEQHSVLADNLTSLAQSLEKSESKRGEDTMVLAKAISDLIKVSIHQGRMLKSVQAKLGVYATQPVGRKSATNEELAKAEATRRGGGQPNPNTLQPNDVLDTLEAMFVKSMEKSDGNDASRGMACTGEKYEEAISKFEQTGDIHPALLADVVRFRGVASRR